MMDNVPLDDWADTKGAYRFFGNTKKVTPARISAPHQQRTVEQMKQHPLVLAVQDTTFFNYTHHPQTGGLGEIGNKKQQPAHTPAELQRLPIEAKESYAGCKLLSKP